jgi:hypothetical protein
MILGVELFGLVVGFLFILVSAVTKEERWQVAYGVVGLMFIFWSFGLFGLGKVTQSLIPALTILFALFSFYTKGTTQLLSIVVTFILFSQVAII